MIHSSSTFTCLKCGYGTSSYKNALIHFVSGHIETKYVDNLGNIYYIKSVGDGVIVCDYIAMQLEYNKSVHSEVKPKKWHVLIEDTSGNNILTPITNAVNIYNEKIASLESEINRIKSIIRIIEQTNEQHIQIRGKTKAE